MNKRQKRALLSAFLILMCVWPVLGQTENQKLCDRLQVELIGSNPATAIKKPDGQWQVFWPGKNRFCPTISLLLKYKQAELINGKILLNYENPNEVVESLGSSLTSYLKTKQDPIEELNAFLLANRDKYDILGWAVEPGDAVAFAFTTLHGAPANASPDRRRVISVRWVGDDARFADRPGATSPAFPDLQYEPGEPFDGEDFPVLYPAT